jgi:hypothetical protein
MAGMPYENRNFGPLFPENEVRNQSTLGFMTRTKKRWVKPMLKSVPIFFECTCYAGAV